MKDQFLTDKRLVSETVLSRSSDDKTEDLLLVGFLALAMPLVAFLARHIDDNRLTSWNWVFRGYEEFFFTYLWLIPAVVAAWMVSKYAIEKCSSFVLCLISFLCVVPFWAEPEVIVDSARYFVQAKYLATHGVVQYYREWGKELFAWTDLPLIPLVYGLILKAFGEARLSIQIANTLFFSGTVLLTYLLGKTLWDRETGFYGGLMLLGFPYLFTQIPLMLVDVPTMFFLMLAVVTYAKAIEKGGVALLLLAGFAFCLAFFAKYSTWVLLSVMAVITLVRIKHGPALVIKRTVVVCIIIIGILGAACLPLLEVIRDQIAFLITYQKPGLKRWGESFLSTFFFQIHPFVTITALFSVVAAGFKRDGRYLVISYLAVLLLIIMQVKRIRYTLPIFPMLALMSAYGVMTLENPRIRRFLALCTIAGGLVLAVAGFLPFLRNMSAVNVLAAGRFLNGLPVENVQVVTVPVDGEIINPLVSVPHLDLFSDRKITYNLNTAPQIDLETVKTSSLRFTWEFKLPELYSGGGAADKKSRADALVMISSDLNQVTGKQDEAASYQQKRIFDQTTSIFSHNTFVTVYFDTPTK